jgi:2-haloacid dehalogenase
MLAAAHTDDLRAARAEGLRTAFIARPHEYGPRQTHVPAADGEADLAVDDLLVLAERLGA